MATVTIGLHELLGRADLGLTQLSGPRADRTIRWVHICELPDPGLYLTGGELLLTAGVDFPDSRVEIHRYVRRLVAAGAAGLGFGVTPVHDEVPPDLLTACQRHGLPLLLVPSRTSFLVISQVVSLMLAAQERAGQHRISVAQAALTRAAARPDGVAAVVRQLGAALGGWAVLVDARHRLSSGGAVPADAGEVEELAARLLAPGGPSSATAHRDGGQVVALALGRTDRVLVAGREPAFFTADRAILEVGVALLTVLSGADRLPAPVAESVTALLALVLDGPAAEVETHVAAAAGVPAGGAWQVVRARRAGAAGEIDRAEVATRLGTPLAGLLADGGVRALVPATGPCPLAADPRWLVAVSAPVRWAELPGAARRVERLLRQAVAQGHSITESPRAGVDGLVPQAEAAEFALARLAPLSGHPASLVETLRAWLAGGGNWETAAVVLGVHRNTVRHRVATAAKLLGCDPQDPDIRAELWLALRWLPEDRPAQT
ncbi:MULTISPECIES: PucR family transcriptional regulator [unclassified Crossiella]|uniref:PucR family transcriptional regulator n=1 Tax=unclassified Crossiella TaxID=2620835 RepID=UPI001FFE3EF4|nr:MULTISPECIES: PucR family transcriptional regulator [unclassified Crossiella]MCK2240321.1 PucR family transcriptional regulator [Crossiella sp. S99.2]MCK2253227.1 PucR family transcriptional regulator [Crossiella sp. S99.1]